MSSQAPALNTAATRTLTPCPKRDPAEVSTVGRGHYYIGVAATHDDITLAAAVGGALAFSSPFSARTLITMDIDMNEADALEALSAILERLTDNPYDIALHVEHIRIARATGMEDQVDAALDMVTTFWAAGDAVWLPLLERKIATSDLQSPDDLKATLQLFTRAEGDYLCTCRAPLKWT